MMKQNKRIAILACIPAVLLLLSAMVCIIFVPQIRYSRYLKQKDYTEMIVVYENRLKSLWDFDQKIFLDLNDCTQAVYENYRAQTVEYQAAQREIESIAQTGYADPDIVQNTISHIQELNDSRKKYTEAVSKDNAKSYVEAVALYKQVIADDSDYETAQMRIANIPQEFRTYTEEAAQKEEETENFAAANEFLQTYLDFKEDDELLQRLNRNTALIEAAASAEKGDFAQAQEILEAYNEDAIVSDKLKLYREQAEQGTEAETSESSSED